MVTLKSSYQCKDIILPRIPKLEKPALFLGAHGELFNYATLEKDGLVFTMSEVNIPPGKGPPAHMHHFVAEYFYAPEGGITMFASDADYLDIDSPPSFEKGDQVTVYLIPLKPKQIFYSPRHRVHGYVNRDHVDRPLTCFWKPYSDAPDFKPYNDGGTREFFEAVHVRVEDPNDMSSVTEKRRTHYIRESHQYAVPHSSYFLQFINRVGHDLPASLQEFQQYDELNDMIELVQEWHKGNKSVICT